MSTNTLTEIESKIDSLQTQAENTYDVIVVIKDLLGTAKLLIDTLTVRVSELEKKS